MMCVHQLLWENNCVEIFHDLMIYPPQGFPAGEE